MNYFFGSTRSLGPELKECLCDFRSNSCEFCQCNPKPTLIKSSTNPPLSCVNLEPKKEPMKCTIPGNTIFEKDVTINGDLVVNGTCTTTNSTTRTITPIVYNPIEKDVELSKFILDQFKTYDSQIEFLQEKIRHLEERVSQNFTRLGNDDSLTTHRVHVVKGNDKSLEEKVRRLEETVSQLFDIKLGRIVYT